MRFLILAAFLAACTQASTTPTLEQLSLQSQPIQMLAARAAHTATLLPDGRVLIAGGFGAHEEALASTEFFDPETNTFSAGPEMSVARQSHTAALLQNGKVLITGGFNGDYLASAELYDPASGTFKTLLDMTTARSGHTATLLPDGRVLLIGGVSTGWTFLASAEIFDSQNNSFAPTGEMLMPRESHTANLLGSGQVLVTGGHSGRQADIVIYDNSELYDPATGIFTSVGELNIQRHKHDAVLLADGCVLVVGGADERDDRGQYDSAEIYDPNTDEFTPLPDMTTPRYKFYGTSLLLKDGRVLLLGGAATAELFDPNANSFVAIEGGTSQARLFATATLLADGRVLFAGGYGTNTAASTQAWIVSVK